MSTPVAAVSVTLFGKTRRAVLALLYGHPDESFHLRQIVRAVGAGVGAVQREVRQLSDAGIIRRTARGNQVLYQANPHCPVFAELKSLVVKTAGVAEVLRGALEPLSDRIKLAFLYGSVARSEEHSGSDVDVLVVGGADFSEVVSALDSAQEALGREINPTVYPLAEFLSKLAAGHHFLTSLIREKKIFLIGDERELPRLAPKPVAHRTQEQRPRN